MENYLQQVRKAKQGDTTAFANLYREIYPDLYRFALYTLREKSDAEDAVSEAVLYAFSAISELRSEDAFKSWMFRILSNKCKDRLREHKKKEGFFCGDLTQEQPGREAEDDILVRQMFFELSEEERLILAMHLFAGYTGRETAALLHMNENTVRSKESRALKKLAGKMGAKEKKKPVV